MKKIKMIILAAAVAHTPLFAVPDPFYPLNEYYSYESSLAIITGFADMVGDAANTNAGIHVSGKIWRDGKLVKPATYTFAGWATGCASYVQGAGITGTGTDNNASIWTDTSRALGQATSSDTSAVTVLGDGGSITLTFAGPIGNGTGYDFAVFENALSDTFLELGFVEVSTDGVHFVRFPNFYLGTTAVGSDAVSGANDPTYIYNLGDKYRVGFGTGYDLAELELAYEYIMAHWNSASSTVTETSIFSQDYAEDFLMNYAYLNLEQVNYVKIVDIVGDGNTVDSSGSAIYDAYPTSGTPGFDLDGIGVLNYGTVPEPAAFAAVLGALSLFAAMRRRKR